MKAAVYYETGGPEVFRYEDVPGPQPLDLAQRFGDAVQLDLGGEGGWRLAIREHGRDRGLDYLAGDAGGFVGLESA